MSQSLCIRCLQRSLAPSRSTLDSNVPRAAFSTTPTTSAAAPRVVKPQTKGKKLTLSRNVRVVGKAPPPGERRAFKRRIIISNTNALEVAGLQDLNAEELKRTTAEVQDAESNQLFQGQMRGFSDETVDALRALEAFQVRQAWSLFRRPATVISEHTVAFNKWMSGVDDSKEGAKETKSVIVDGQRATGKSVLLLQALAMAHLRGWIVIHFPDAKDLVNAHTSYAPLPTRGESKMYMQPHYTAQILGNIAKANGKVLSELQLSMEHNLPKPVQAKISLDRFAMMGAEDPEMAWPVFAALWRELTAPSKSDRPELQRPPLLVGLDGLNHIMGESAYLDADAEPIHTHDLALVRDFVGALANPQQLGNGGMVIAATSGSHRPSSPALEYCLDVNRGEPDPYFPYDKRVMDAVSGTAIHKIRLQGISKGDARAVMEYWARSGILRAAVTDSLVNDKWSLSGGGIIGEMERATVRTPYHGIS